MKWIKKLKFPLFLIFCFLLGFVTMPLFHNGYVGSLLNSFTLMPWWVHILLFLAVLFVSLALHELIHFIAFIMMGYKNEMLIIFLFIFYKENNTWKLKINPKLLLLGGGLVWPDLGVINNEYDFLKARKAMQVSLLAAPLFTVINGIVPLVIAIVFFYGTICVPIAFYIWIVSIFYTYVSSLETDQIKGDFKAYKQVKHNDDFAHLALMQYTDTSKFQYDYMQTYLKKNKATNQTTKSYLTNLLEHSIFKSTEIDLFLYEKVMSYVENTHRFSNLILSSDGAVLAQYIMFFLDKANHKKDAFHLFNVFRDSLDKQKIKDTYKNYFIRQTSHLLSLSDESDFINNPKNMQTSMLSFILISLPSYVESERTRNKGYIPFILECPL